MIFSKKNKNTNNIVVTLLRCAEPFVIISVIFLFSLYSFFNARNDSHTGDLLLLFMLPISCIPNMLSDIQPKRNLNIMFWSFFVLTLASVIFPPTQYANIYWFNKSIFRLIIVLYVFVNLTNTNCFGKLSIKWGMGLICLALFTISIATSYGVLDKTIVSFLSPFEIVSFKWNTKYYAYWFVFLMWGTVYFLWRQSMLETLFAVIIMLLAIWVIFLTDTESAQLALIVSLITFVLGQIPLKKNRYKIYLSAFFVIIISPLVWIICAPIMPIYKSSFLFELLHKIPGIYARIPFYDVASQAIKKEILLGYGFGSALSLQVPPVFIEYVSITFPGGHPHNVVLLFFLEQGLFGLIWLFTSLFVLFNYLIENTNSKGGAAVWALVIAGQIIFSFSFSIWQMDVMFMYMMFFLLITICTGRTENKEELKKDLTFVNHIFLIIALLGLAVYIANHYIF